MPRFGRFDIKELNSAVREIQGFGTEALTLKGAQVLTISHEIAASRCEDLIPPALNPSIPPYAQCVAMAFPESPWGPFSMAEFRVVGRAAFRPRAFVLRTYFDNPQAERELSRRWGYLGAPGKIDLSVRHERIIIAIEDNGKRVLEAEMIDREPVSGSDIQYIASMHLARNREDGKLMLVQVDPEYVFSKAERGWSNFVHIDHAAWHTDDHLALTNRMLATYTICDVTLPNIRYVCDPNRSALEGTVRVGKSQ